MLLLIQDVVDNDSCPNMGRTPYMGVYNSIIMALDGIVFVV